MVQCHLQVIGSGKADTGLSIILFFDDHRYLFDCGEGTQRLCAEKGLNLFRVDTIFFTQLDSCSAGGLFGTLLTLADAGKTRLNLYGPAGLVRFFSASSSFYRRPSLELSLKEIDDAVESLYQDNNIHVDGVSLAFEHFPKEVDVAGRQPKKPRTITKTSVVSYVVTLKDIPGKFDPVAAKALNVPKGPLFGRLSKGEAVTLSDGKVVLPSQVVSESFPGPCIAIICCPNIHYISSVTSSSKLNRFALRNVQGSKEKKERHLCVVHLCTFTVLEDTSYRDWAICLGEDVYHIFLLVDSLDAPLVFDTQAELLRLLSNSVDKELFQVPKDTFSVEKSDRRISYALQKDIKEKWSKVDVIFGVSLLKYHLAPTSKIGVDPTTSRLVQDEGFLETNMESGSEESLSIDYGRSEEEQSFSKSPSCFEDVGELIFLGTGAAIPSKLRNVSGIYLHLYHRGGVLFDCGEGTFGQMLRVFGINELDYFIVHLKLIFISHMHADHHLGILRILEYRLKLDTEQPVIVMGPLELNDWLKEYEQVNSQFFHYVFMDNESFTYPQQPIVNYLSSNIGLQVETVPVLHCFHAYGIVLLDNIFEWKMVYSGDTMPCDALIRAGQDATLVVHEATFESSMEKIALEKGHCTYRQAVDVCKAMNAQWIILTHFSQRYSKLPVIDSLSDTNVFVAFDLLRVPFARLSQLPSLLPVLSELFKDEEERSGSELHNVY